MTQLERERAQIVDRLEHMAGDRRYKDVNRRFFANTVIHLRSMQPRVLSEEEALAWCMTPRDERDPVFEEFKPEVLPDGCGWINPRDDAYGGTPATSSILLPGYGVVRRWWTSRPTHQLMAEMPWFSAEDLKAG